VGEGKGLKGKGCGVKVHSGGVQHIEDVPGKLVPPEVEAAVNRGIIGHPKRYKHKEEVEGKEAGKPEVVERTGWTVEHPPTLTVTKDTHPDRQAQLGPPGHVEHLMDETVRVPVAGKDKPVEVTKRKPAVATEHIDSKLCPDCHERLTKRTTLASGRGLTPEAAKTQAQAQLQEKVAKWSEAKGKAGLKRSLEFLGELLSKGKHLHPHFDNQIASHDRMATHFGELARHQSKKSESMRNSPHPWEQKAAASQQVASMASTATEHAHRSAADSYRAHKKLEKVSPNQLKDLGKQSARAHEMSATIPRRYRSGPVGQQAARAQEETFVATGKESPSRALKQPRLSPTMDKSAGGKKSDDWISDKISYLMKEEGKPQNQAIAIAYSMAGRSRKKMKKSLFLDISLFKSQDSMFLRGDLFKSDAPVFLRTELVKAWKLSQLLGRRQKPTPPSKIGNKLEQQGLDHVKQAKKLPAGHPAIQHHHDAADALFHAGEVHDLAATKPEHAKRAAAVTQGAQALSQHAHSLSRKE
jgi:hypothetical protein